MNNNEANSPKIMIELSSTDTGDDTLKRFRYQHTSTAYLALSMYMSRLPYTELVCEHHEDILAKLKNQKFVGIQIKTQDSKFGFFDLKKDSLMKSLIRFIELDVKYPDEFDSFVFIGNCNFLDDGTGNSPLKLRQEAILYLEDNSHIIKPKTLDKSILKLCNKSNATREVVLSTLARVNYQSHPSMDDIESKIIDSTISCIPKCNDLTVEMCRNILNGLIFKIYQKSSLKLNTPIEDYKNLLKSDIVSPEIINEKRLTCNEIEQALNVFNQLPFYFGQNLNSMPFSERGNSSLMKEKMSAGAIDSSTINLMDVLRNDSELYFLQSFHKNEMEEKKYNHIRTLIWNEASEIESKVRKKGEVYGEVMLELLQDRLKELSKISPEQMGYCPYEILKGQIGVLTGECKIKFSKIPGSGWKNAK